MQQFYCYVRPKLLCGIVECMSQWYRKTQIEGSFPIWKKGQNNTVCYLKVCLFAFVYENLEKQTFNIYVYITRGGYSIFVNPSILRKSACLRDKLWRF